MVLPPAPHASTAGLANAPHGLAHVESISLAGNTATRTNTHDDNGDGVVDRSQVQTATSADGNTMTVARDSRGWFDQTETDMIAANDNQLPSADIAA